jgi:hypothetical protein
MIELISILVLWLMSLIPVIIFTAIIFFINPFWGVYVILLYIIVLGFGIFAKIYEMKCGK